MKTFLTVLIALFFGAGCSNEGKHVSYATYQLWDITSEHIEIIKDNGELFSDLDRIERYEYSKNDFIIPAALTKLKEIVAVGGGDHVYCLNDDPSYEIRVTSFNDIVTTYVSDNRACGKENQDKFISTEDIEEVIRYLIPSTL